MHVWLGGITIIQFITCLKSSIEKYNNKLSIAVKFLRSVTLWLVKGPVTNYPWGGGDYKMGKPIFHQKAKPVPLGPSIGLDHHYVGI